MAPKDRWLYHVRIVLENRTWPYEANSLRSEGFVHASFRDAVVRTAELYFSPQANLEVLAIDPRKLDTRVELAKTPRGEMPHVFGPVPKESVVAIYPLADFRTLSLPDRVTPMTDRLAVVRAESKTAEPYDAFFALRDALIACADESENAKADHEVVTYLREAESCQWGIGTFATGSGEGIDSMTKVYTLMHRRGRAHRRLAQSGADASGEHVAEAEKIDAQIASDPNGLGEAFGFPKRDQ
ncbi:MAG TPA: DUF952 domain-containing protein [Polyangiaceae bacterium]